MPRAALLSIHARVAETEPSTWEDPSLIQLWGPRFSAYVVARRDLAAFTLGRHTDDAKGRLVAEDLAARLRAFLGGRTMTYSELRTPLAYVSLRDYTTTSTSGWLGAGLCVRAP